MHAPDASRTTAKQDMVTISQSVCPCAEGLRIKRHEASARVKTTAVRCDRHMSYAQDNFGNFSLLRVLLSPKLAAYNGARRRGVDRGDRPMRQHARAWKRLAAIFTIIFTVALGIGSQMSSQAAAAENWDLYIYNPVATVAAVKGMNVIIEQIEKETGGELKIRLHLGGSLPINTTTITQAVSDDVVQMGDDGYFLGNVPIGGVLRLPMLIRSREEYAKAAGDRRSLSGSSLRQERPRRPRPVSLPVPGRLFAQQADQPRRLQGPEDPRHLAGAGRVHQAARRRARSRWARPRCRRRSTAAWSTACSPPIPAAAIPGRICSSSITGSASTISIRW